MATDRGTGTSLVEQRVGSWGDWPDDVRERLRGWNGMFLLSFRRGPDFLCEGCGRQIRSHPTGNAVVRPWQKAHGVLRCEDCLVALARCYELPPQVLAPRAHDVTAGWRRWIQKLEKRIKRLEQQLWVDQTYMDRLEEEITAARLDEIHDELRGRYRKDDDG